MLMAVQRGAWQHAVGALVSLGVEDEHTVIWMQQYGRFHGQGSGTIELCDWSLFVCLYGEISCR